jgi:NFU1 iron-sulfur cluster scaffold homolog, mitochondrial
MSEDLLIHVQPTPNPKALKFIVNRDVKSEGKATFSNQDEAQPVRLAYDLFGVPGVSQLHFYENFVTVTFDEKTEPAEHEAEVCSIIHRDMPIHNPNFELASAPKRVSKSNDPDVLKIEDILDRTIRPGLQGDGGDIEIVSYKDNTLEVIYQGACGTCPSSSQGTLMAIESILRDEFNPEIKVQIVF